MTKETVLAMEHFSRVSNVYNGVRTTDPEPVCYIQQHLDHLDRIAGAEVGAGGGRYSWLLLQAIPGLQTSVEDSFRGRVFGTYSATVALVTIMGMGAAGTLGDWLGILPMLSVGSGLFIAAGAVALVSLPRS